MRRREHRLVCEESTILQFQVLKTAAGGSGVGDGSGSGGRGGASWKRLRANQEFVCRILEAVPGGYLIKVDDVDLPSYLISEACIEPGQEILAQFFCSHKRNLILCPLAG
ncbi:MAG: hypothetical protein WC028_24330 [Candidatus Obscuribacterales bacterium]